MAAINSQTFNGQSKGYPQQDKSVDNLAPATIETIADDIELTQQLVQDPSEWNTDDIALIQEALLNEDFDFSQLPPTAAGQNEANNLNAPINDKSQHSPILLEEDGLIIQYRSTELPLNERADLIESTPVLTNNEPANATAVVTSAPQSSGDSINISLSEDFITRAQGKLDIGTGFTEQTLDSRYGSLSVSTDGTWVYQLNNQLTDIQSLGAGQSLNETLTLKTASGKSVELNIAIQGSNDQALINGDKTGQVTADTVENLQETPPSVSGKLQVQDMDNGEARFIENAEIQGNFGIAQINASGEWHYSLNNHSDAVQGLRTGEKLLDLFSIKTVDGTKQLIQISIEGVDDKPILGGSNLSILDLESQLETSGALTIRDPDFGQSAFQPTNNISSKLGYGSAEIDAQGNWLFTLDHDFTSANPVIEGQTRIDSFDVFTVDGTSQTIHIPIQGSNQPLYAQTDTLKTQQLLVDTQNQESLFGDSTPTESSGYTAPNLDIAASFTATNSDSLLQIEPAHNADIGLV